MKIDDIELLKRIYRANSVIIKVCYRYDEFVPDNTITKGAYHPRCIIDIDNTLYLLDYTKTAEEYLKLRITSSTAKLTFTDFDHYNTVLRKFDNITVEEAQEIIDRNIMLFKQIQVKAKENEMIDQISEL